MTAAFIEIFNISISASWMILAVVLLRLCIKRLPRWITCVLWGMVAIRLLLPFSIAGPFSLLPSENTIPQEVLTETVPSIDSGITVLDEAVNPVLEEIALSPSVSVDPPADTDEQEPLFAKVFRIGMWIWLVGMLGFLMAAEISYLMLRWRLSDATIVDDRVRFSNRIDSPFVFGLFRPYVYLCPNLTEEQRRYVLAHENHHLKRLDYLSKPIAFCLLSVYWFNPFVWLAYILFCRDLEVSCDEGVIRSYDLEGRKAYATALLECRTNSRLASVCPVSFGEIGIKKRVKHVFSFRTPLLWVSIVALVCCLSLAGCFLMKPTDPILPSEDLPPAPTASTTTTTATVGEATTTTTTSTAASATTTTTTTTVSTTKPFTSDLRLTQHPTSLAEIPLGNTVQFTVKAEKGTGEYRYQWQYQSTDAWRDIPASVLASGVDSPTLSLTTFSDSVPQSLWKWMHNGKVRCVVTDRSGTSVVSNTATLTIQLTASIGWHSSKDEALLATVYANTGYVTSQWEYQMIGSDTWHSIYTYNKEPYYSHNKEMCGYNLSLYYVYDYFGRDRADYRYRCTITDEAGRQVTTKPFIVYEEDAP